MVSALAAPQVRITVVDRHQAFGRGVAYGAPGAHHRINVPARKMGGVQVADEDGFVRWLDAQQRPHDSFAESFVPRAWFGDYLWAQLDAARARGTVTLCAGEVRSLQRLPDGRWLCSGEGLALQADQVVLCTGNTPPTRTAPPAAGGRFIPDVWAPGALDPIGPADSVLVQGTGATAIDALLELRQRGHQGPVTMVSRRGLLPLVDVPTEVYPDFFDAGARTLRLRAVLRRLREEVRDAAAQGRPWQSVVDAFRVHAARIWLALDVTERRRFLRHVRAHWMVHRHRLAPDIAAQLARMQAAGALEVVAARILRTAPAGDQVAVDLRPRGRDDATRQLRADWVLNCIGPSESFSRLDDPLWRQLLDQGIARPGPLDLGVEVDADLRLIARDGQAHPDLFTLGLPTRGQFWEVTAVVHIRQQAHALVQRWRAA